MLNFPDFMLTNENTISSKSQSKGLKGWAYVNADGGQIQ